MTMLYKTVSLDCVATVGAGQTFREKAETESPSSGIRLIQIKDVREGCLVKADHLPFANIEPEKLKINLKAGDVLLPLRGERVEALLFNTNTDYIVTTTNQVAVISSDSSCMMPEFLLWYLNSHSGKERIIRMQSGGTIQNITISKLSKLTIELPPISVQAEVVEIYNVWQQQKKVLHEMLINGEVLADQLCVSKIIKKRTRNDNKSR